MNFDINTYNYVIIILMVLLIDRAKRVASRNIISCWLFNIPGTVLHELAHFVIAFVSNGRPCGFSILPKKQVVNGNKYYQLGSVKIANASWYNSFFIAFAPLLLWIPIILLNKFFFFYLEDNLLNNILFVYLLIVLIDSSIPSRADFKQAYEGSKHILFAMIIVVFSYLLYKEFLS